MSGSLFPLDDEAGSLSSQLILHPFQQLAVDRVLDTLASHRSCLCLSATGTGKTEMIVALIQAYASIGRGALVISPLTDLVAQTAARLRSRGISCGIEQGALKSGEDVTVASYLSLLSRRRYEKYVGTVAIAFVDEVHLNYSKNSQQMLGYLREAGTKIVGLTASPDRATGDPLTDWYGPVAFEYGIKAATDDGYLVEALLWLTVLEDLDLSKYEQGGNKDFEAAELGRFMAREKSVQAIASLIEQHWDGLPSVVFCQGIAQSELLREVLGRKGIASAIVHSEMDKDERQMHLSDFENGRVGIILNVGCLTLGWDHPALRKVFIAKPTRSCAKYIQMYGRGTRTLPGVINGLKTAAERKAAIAASDKPYFEVFDITDTCRNNSLITAIDVVRPDTDKLLRRRVQTRNLNGPIKEIDAVIEQERKQEAQEQAARDALTAADRIHLTADGKFAHYARDQYAGAEGERPKPKRRWVMLFGKAHKGKPLRDVPTGYLQWVLRESNCRNEAFLEAIKREVAGRR